MERNTNPLYFLRFVAALAIVFFHYTPEPEKPGLNWLNYNSDEAVTFFFFISGFVMVLTNGNYLTAAVASFSKNEFYLKRFARIYPLYIFAIITLASFHYGIRPIDTDTVKYRLIFETLAIQRWLYAGSFNYPGWSISAEFFFYLLFPFALVFMRSHPKKYTWLVCGYYILAVGATQALAYLKEMHMPGAPGKIADILFMHPVFKFAIFLAGTLCGKAFVESRITYFRKKWNRVFAMLASAAVILFAKYTLPFEMLGSGLLSPVYFVFVLAVTGFSKRGSAIFSTPLMLFLGEISYGVYILQYPVYVYFNRYLTKVTTLQSLVLYAVTLVIVASVTYHLVEKPAKKLVLSMGARKQ
ncbi:acyltransferase family protein [Hufsiella ginkgonis]|uniref:Acyltransferase family protein n=1 Tax=Hufsiella ginkgonis TaxID=2695274 RepID=A0A7K1Y2K8_9SPHI|nr:acyltransferase [Hufsiella ginkgonis]MXV17481.1 acyltransferase family protein [Hufsiella ginkgonis]